MADTTQAQLDRLQALIAQIEDGAVAAYTDGGIQYTRLNLPALYQREEQLLKRLAAENGGNFRLGTFLRDRG